MVVDPDCLPKDWDANSSKTQELGDENMGARRNADPQMALGGHFSLTPLIYGYLRREMARTGELRTEMLPV